MKKLFSIILFAVFTLVAGVFFTSCCGKDDNRIITITDASGLSDVKLKIGEDYLESENSTYAVGNYSNVTVEFNAGEYGVDFDNIEIFVNGVQLDIDNDVFGKENEFGESKYDPTPDVGNLYFGYIKLARIENDVNIQIDGLKMISTSFKFDLKNSEDIEDEEIIKKMQLTKISFANDEDSDDDYNVNLYDFMKSDNRVIEKEFDDNEIINQNTYRFLRIRFDGIRPFSFEELPFKVYEEGNENEVYLNYFYLDKTFYIDYGKINLKEKKNYSIVVDFSGVNYYEYEVNLPQKNETYEIKYTVKNNDKTTVNYTDTVEFQIIEKMTKKETGIYADYTNLKLEINGMNLELDKDNKCSFQNWTPLTTIIQSESFDILVKDIKYYKIENEDEKEINPISFDVQMEIPYFSTPLFIPTIYRLDGDQKADISGINESGEIIGFEGDKTVLAWEYSISEDIGTYKSMINLQKYDIYLNNQLLLKLGDVLNNMTFVSDDLYTSQELNGFILKARKNSVNNIFDKFELIFNCAPQPEKLIPPEENEDEPTIIYLYEMNFRFTNGEIWRKSVDISYDFKESNVLKAETRIYRTDAIVQDSWRTLTKEKPSLTLNDVECSNIVEFKLTLSVDNDTYFKLKEPRLESEKLDNETYKENNNFVIILRYYVVDDYYPSNATHLKYDLVS